MKNLYIETIQAIEDNNHTTAEVDWVGTSDGNAAMSWKKFADIANIDYNDNLRALGIPLDLCVVFTDGTWLERCKDYLGEHWGYCIKPRRRSLCYNFNLRKIESGLDGCRCDYSFYGQNESEVIK